ncbi:hypothetical protein HPB50_010841 [Hyalomma asiaticum]|uniref:Uncharacterized protein n=1 Tax=Hyalomma asiaticum TaxID=266040 RepID=A0ACB7RRM2_HYAAI|nr:hypothetical protein HPB50_010841 [Hyalomma asiaticum]
MPVSGSVPQLRVIIITCNLCSCSTLQRLLDSHPSGARRILPPLLDPSAVLPQWVPEIPTRAMRTLAEEAEEVVAEAVAASQYLRCHFHALFRRLHP